MQHTISSEVTLYRYFAEAVNQPLAIVDADFKSVIWNSAFEELCGDPLPVEGHDIFTYMCPAENREKFQSAVLARIDSGQEFEFIQSSRRVFMISANTLRAGKSYSNYRMLIFREITQERMLLQEREDFISIASHELKAPIAIIGAYSQIIEREAKSTASGGLQIFASKINQQAKKLVSLSSTLLDISELQARTPVLKLSFFNLNELIAEIIENFSFTHPSHHITTFISGPLTINADRSKIMQVLNNLISNAIKYSPNQHEVTVIGEQVDGGVAVSVMDKGIGIPKHEQEKLFLRFSRTDLTDNQNIPGTGLGLYICKEIIYKHHGRLWVDSDKGAGTAFHFFLPVNQ